MTHGFTATSKQLGTGRNGTLQATYGQLVAILGEPTRPTAEDSDGKVQARWGAHHSLGNVAVWDYKQDVPPEQVREWSLYASGPAVETALRTAVASIDPGDGESERPALPTHKEILAANWGRPSARECEEWDIGPVGQVANCREFTMVHDGDGQIVLYCHNGDGSISPEGLIDLSYEEC